jgi:hypothetical protein
MSAIGRIAKSYLTGPDGESYAPGRLMAFIMFGVAQVIVATATVYTALNHPATQDWLNLFNGVQIFEPMVAGACVALILGQAPTDSGGKWWAKEASPPPPPPKS